MIYYPFNVLEAVNSCCHESDLFFAISVESNSFSYMPTHDCEIAEYDDMFNCMFTWRLSMIFFFLNINSG